MIDTTTPTATTRLAEEIANGDVLTLPQLAARLKLDPSAIFRWLNKGFADGQGGCFRLEGLKRGRVWLTSTGAYRRFLERHPISTEPTTGNSTPRHAPTRSPKKRTREQAVARAELEKRGI